MSRLLRALRIWWQCMGLEQELAGHQEALYELSMAGISTHSPAGRAVREEMAILRARIAKIKAS